MSGPVNTDPDCDCDMQSGPVMVSFTFDGREFRGQAGQPLAVAMLVAGQPALRPDERLGGMRGAFCLMGVCQECVVLVGGRRVEACREPLREGLIVELAR